MTARPAQPPFVRLGPVQPCSPLILSVPHAGRAYSEALLGAARVPPRTLEALEDRLADLLVGEAVAAGATAFVALAPRAEIDLNRDERELDPALIAPPLPSGALLQSPRSRGGLGLIPSRIAGAGALWLRRISRDELSRRIETIHRPYHDALAAALAAARARFGVAILLDCHSMPPRPAEAEQAQVVLGDRHGASISPEFVDAAEAAARRLGFGTARNAPYAGGHIVARHGRPETGIHALQVEIDRALYLNRDLQGAGPGLARCAALIGAIAAALTAAAGNIQALAAE